MAAISSDVSSGNTYSTGRSLGNKDLPLNVSKQLEALKHEKKNHNLHRLPPSTTVQRRPINHPPIASPFAGAEIQKVVYVSARTPLMGAVKRVKKLLALVEKRATQSAHATSRNSAANARNKRSVLEGANGTTKNAHDVASEINDQVAVHGEEVLVKASGRAMEQALKIGEWFKTREKEMLCHVEVRTGSVSVVDDIVEIDGQDEETVCDHGEPHGGIDGVADETIDGDVTMELLGQTTESKEPQAVHETITASTPQNPSQKAKKKRKKRKRPMYDENDVPEARLRWIKTVEVAISLRH